MNQAVAAPGQAAVVPSAALRVAGSRGPLQRALVRTIRNPMGLLGAAIVTALVATALAAPLLAPYDPVTQHPGYELLPPTIEFPLGTDQLGRDLLSRLIYGGRPSFIVGIIAVGIGAGIGVLTGLVAGYLGGAVDSAIMRAYDVVVAFPPILLGIAVVAVLGPGVYNVAYALAIAIAPYFARVTRASVLTEKRRDYVLAARSTGVRAGRVMLAHVLPNCLAPLLVQLALAMGISVLAEAGLSFLGLGTQPPTASWGQMLNGSRQYLRTDPWLAVWPGLALALLLLGVNFLADALRDALDPRRVNG
ncbi:MAG: ABC transporter permease [Chloroflexota bacterium]|nr:ABC transporter permease [Chloroflexota bacterium]